MGQWDNSQGYIGVSNKTWGTLTFGRTNSLTDTLQASMTRSAVERVLADRLLGFVPRLRRHRARSHQHGADLQGRDPERLPASSTVRLGGPGADRRLRRGKRLDGRLLGSRPASTGATSRSTASSDRRRTPCRCRPTAAAVTACGPGNSVHQPKSTTSSTASAATIPTMSSRRRCRTTSAARADWRATSGTPSSSTAATSTQISRTRPMRTPAASGRSTSGIFVPAGAVTSKAYRLQQRHHWPQRAYACNKVLQTFWTGVKYSVPDDWLHGWGSLDLAAAFYYQTQNNFNFAWKPGRFHGVPYGYATAAACTGTGAFISSSKCAGSQDAHLVLRRLEAGQARRHLRRRDDPATCTAASPTATTATRPTSTRSRKTIVTTQRRVHADLGSDDRHPHPVLIDPTPELAENGPHAETQCGRFA